MMHRLPRFTALSLLIALLVQCVPTLAIAAPSSWSPSLLVNTESFQVIDEGDSTTNIYIQFGQLINKTLTYDRTKARFQFNAGLSVVGTLSGSNLNIDRNATLGGTLTATGSIMTKSTFSGTTLRIGTGGADIHGTLSASGSVRTDGDLTINDDQTGADAVLTFGNSTGNNPTVKYLNTAQKFQFSKGTSVIGHLSGSSLNVDRNATVGGTLTATGAIRTKGNLSGASLNVDSTINWRGITYTAPTTQSANTFLKTDGAGGLTWASQSSGNGSGGIMSLHPEFPNAILFSSGSTYIGQLSASGGVAGINENFYHWQSTKATIQDYWISVRVRLPDNFSSWDVMKPIELRYRTQDGTATNNHVTIRIKDTANTERALTGGGALANSSFTTANITGPEGGGTWAAKGYITLYIKLASLTGKFAELGFINLNYETTTP